MDGARAMTGVSPVIVRFTSHAERRVLERRLDLHEIADLLLGHHDQWRRNPREADWLVRARGVAIVYNWPDGEDDAKALVISAWRE
jgi:hypothetical protein